VVAPILLDTDIGSDIDDAMALAYLLAHPDCDLLGITAVTGEAVKRCRMASVLCRLAGRSVPIHAGIEKPLRAAPRQTACPQAEGLSRWPHDTDFPADTAVDFLRDVIRSRPGEVTLLAIGPLTNVATLFTRDPEIPRLLRSLVLMAGAFTDACSRGTHMEWNVQLDPEAADIVYRAPVPRLVSVGLDVTTQVVMNGRDFLARCDRPRLLGPVADFTRVWLKDNATVTFHDPLAAALIFEPALCGLSRGRITVELEREGVKGATWFSPDDPKGPHEVAFSVEKDRFLEHYFKVLE
jgi:inosine-uridine nucleoside N-ribohydrolase